MRAANGAERRPRGPEPALIGATLAALFAVTSATAAAQEESPVIPPPSNEAVAAESEAPPPPAEDVDAGSPHLQTVAQGAAEVDGPLVWRVRRIEPAAEGTTATTAGAAFFLQGGGASLLRAGESGRPVRLEPGEAALVSAEEDAALQPAGTEPASGWVVELVAPNASAGEGLGAGTVLFTSDIIEDYPAGTIDAELRRGVLLGNEVAEVAPATGPLLLLVTSGQVQLTPEGGEPETVDAGDAGVARLEATGATLRNPNARPAVFVVAALGETIEAAERAGASERTNGANADEAPPADADRSEGQQETAGEDADDDQGAEAEETDGEATTTEAEAAAEDVSTVEQVPATTGTDTDGDGLGDEDEAVYGSDPLNADFDADGLADGAEVNQYGTDPLNNDSDGDGLIDGDEANQYGSNPASTDGDGDGLVDQDELFTHGTGPATFDTDGDGVPDGEEVSIYGTDPTDPASAP
ncbi:MAG: thrombospondin type 3 repeat-containing protein [Chloroflexota bacterium]|nr:thrombospondin type 3 repeat-containing protein [Chloroflexota bacterium]